MADIGGFREGLEDRRSYSGHGQDVDGQQGQEPSGCFGEHQVLCEQSGIAEHSQEFAQNVSWQKVLASFQYQAYPSSPSGRAYERTGAAIEIEDITDDGGDTSSGGELGDNEG